MDYEPLVEDKIKAGRAFLEEFNRVAPIKAACWVFESEIILRHRSYGLNP